MGNCCGKESGAFEGEGRTLNATPANATTPSGRSAAAPKVQGPGRTLGESTNASQRPGEAAARAAEERLKASQGKGKLGKQLDAQKARTQSSTLQQTAKENLAARDADAAAQARNYN